MSKVEMVYGIGAAKAGTSWLHGYLSEHPDCYFRALKELHYFNVLNEGRGNWPKAYRMKRLGMIKQKQAAGVTGGRMNWLNRVSQDIEEWHEVFDGRTQDDAAYLAYLKAGAKEGQLIGEITPAYATLDEDGFRHMASVGNGARFIFIMRDPLARLWSNIRMTSKRAAMNGKFAGDVAREQVDAFINHKNPSLFQRSDYRGTIKRLLAVIPREKVLFEFFETLFTPEAMRRITDFLGITPRQADFDRSFHKGDKLALPEDQRGPLLAALAPQYEFVTNMFGQTVPDDWQTSQQHLKMAGN